MSSFPNRQTVLVVEDDMRHLEQIQRRLEAEGVVVHHSRSGDDEDLYNFKALNHESQVVVVDLELRLGENRDEGYRLIRERLWPMDRTTQFIVFSRYISSPDMAAFGRVDPHWTFVEKDEVDAGTLSAGSLDTLADVVLRCCSYSSPTMDTPAYDSYPHLSQIGKWQEAGRCPPRDYSHEKLAQRIRRSIELLQAMTAAAREFAKVGTIANHLAVGVYGSCGRLEMRLDSDVEFSVYYDANDILRPPPRQIAASFWTRLAVHLTQREPKHRCEGWEQVQRNSPPTLASTQVDEDLPNAYRPCISRDALRSVVLERVSHVRNRHFQVLTELRPVFNPAFIEAMKKELISSNVAPNVGDVATIVNSSYFEDVCTQFSMDTKPPSLETWHGLKRFCYRTLGVLALRFALIGYLKYEPLDLDDVTWPLFLERLAEPGVLKVMRFANACMDQGLSRQGPQGEKLRAQLLHVVQSYCGLLARFDQIASASEVRDQSAAQLKSTLRDVAAHFYEALETTKNMDFFAPVTDTRWLFETDRIAAHMARL